MAGIGLAKARTIIRKVLEAGEAAQMKPLSVVVVDAGGHVVAFERSDGSPPGRFEIARAKAYGCIMFGQGGTAMAALAERLPGFSAAAVVWHHGQVASVPGGVLVRDSRGRVIGAIGVTGDTSENDRDLGVAAVEAAGFVPEG
ncbi:MAG: heme-binding protein [Maritimibacter sp.]|nr:heme-binding protein [Maritimibacter sp.]